MGMRMPHRLVLVGMRVALARGERRIMPMPVVFVMLMVVLVRERDVAMPVLVTLAQVQPYPRGHQQAGYRELHGHRLAEKQERQDGARERRGGEISASACRSQLAQCEHKEREAQAVAEESQHRGPRC